MIKTTIAVLLLTSSAYGALGFLSTPYLITRYMAKEYCSCRFVVKQTESVCIDENKTFRLVFRINEDTQAKRVKVTSFPSRAEAEFIDERSGCRLID